jgi:opacity protein-like surface antigen
VTGRAVSAAPLLVIELVAPSSRVRAYADAGVGGGHVRQRYFTSPIETGEPSVERTRSSRVVAVSFGGGASVRVTRQLAIGADVRVLTLLDDESTLDRFIQPSGALRSIRLGSRVSWAF